MCTQLSSMYDWYFLPATNPISKAPTRAIKTNDLSTIWLRSMYYVSWFQFEIAGRYGKSQIG